MFRNFYSMSWWSVWAYHFFLCGRAIYIHLSLLQAWNFKFNKYYSFSFAKYTYHWISYQDWKQIVCLTYTTFCVLGSNRIRNHVFIGNYETTIHCFHVVKTGFTPGTLTVVYFAQDVGRTHWISNDTEKNIEDGNEGHSNPNVEFTFHIVLVLSFVFGETFDIIFHFIQI